jgi:hypothetical protein
MIGVTARVHAVWYKTTWPAPEKKMEKILIILKPFFSSSAHFGDDEHEIPSQLNIFVYVSQINIQNVDGFLFCFIKITIKALLQA